MNMPLNAPNWFIIKHDLPRFVFIFYFCIYFPFHFPLLISTNVFISVFVTCLYAFLLLWANLFICDFGAPPRVTTSQPEIWNEFKLRWILNEYNIESGSAAVACMCFTGLREHENPPRFGTLLIENVYFLLFQHFGLFEERRSECVRKSSHQAIDRVRERRTHTHTHTRMGFGRGDEWRSDADTVSGPVFLPPPAVKSVYASRLQRERVPHGSLIERKQHQSSAGPKAFK